MNDVMKAQAVVQEVSEIVFSAYEDEPFTHSLYKLILKTAQALGNDHLRELGFEVTVSEKNNPINRVVDKKIIYDLQEINDDL